MLAQYTYCKDEEQLKELTMKIDGAHREDIMRYTANLEGSEPEKKESLLEKVSKMKK